MEDSVIDLGSSQQDRFERSKRLEWFDIIRIQTAKVLVVGAGAIGNEVCKNLMLSGFENLTIVDMDHVEYSNLNRCLFFSEQEALEKRLKAEVIAQKMRVLNPQMRVSVSTDPIEDHDEGFITGFDIVLGCLDNISARLHVNAYCYHNLVPYVDGGTLGLIGKVQVVIPPDTSCLECSMNTTHMKIKERRMSCTGEKVTFFEPKLASDINTTSIIAAVQVQEALKIVHYRWDKVLRNLFYYDGNTNVSEVYEIAINSTCFHHMNKDISSEKCREV